MRPRGYILDDCPDETYIDPERGHAEPVTGASDKPVANLWVPDVEARRGWRDYFVYRPEKPGRRAGFRP